MKYLLQLLAILMLSVSFNHSANAQSSTKIKMGELPAAAHDIIHGKYAKYGVNSMLKKQDKNEVLTYEIELQRKSKVVTLTYDEQGGLLKTRKTKEITFDGKEKSNKYVGGRGDGHAGHSH